MADKSELSWFLVSLMTDCIVNNIFVPVSPSGTGKTLSEFISLEYRSRHNVAVERA
tara:strand:+ start:207 stop:374 length:168 start_codon:yes stop_codon:yes gene_type:complete